jgi:blue copper oxidase
MTAYFSRTLVLSPGERAEILVDFSVQAIGESLFLQAEVYGGGGFDLLKFAVGEKGDSLSSLPERLTEIERIPEEQAARIRIFRMQTMGRGGMMGSGRLTINGKKMDLERIDERVRLGDTEIWEIVNERVGMMAIPHSFHPHDIQFQILSRNGEPPAENESGWKDTVLLWPGDRVRIIASFTDFTGIYMYHCHLLEHEDDGMMGQFEVFGL